MSLLISNNILDCMRKELVQCTESVLIISAYCKKSLVEFFDSCMGNKSVDKKLVVRFKMEDIISGASDLEIYPYCKEKGWKLFFRMDLHAKTYVFDRMRCIIGSANATKSGLSVGGVGNFEMASYVELEKNDQIILDRLLLGSVEINDYIYSQMIEAIRSYQTKSGNAINWPIEITELFINDYSVLFSEDFPSSYDPTEINDDDLTCLNLSYGADIEEIRTAFLLNKSYLWLVDLIKNHENQEMYFGSISAALHNSLLNDPKPFRKDVKQLLSNLLNWVVALNIEEIEVDRPNHSQRVRYVNRGV